MVMRKYLILLAAILATFAAFAAEPEPFAGYDVIAAGATNIFIATCVANPPAVYRVSETCSVNQYTVSIVRVLKGKSPARLATVLTERWLNAGDQYLVFGSFQAAGECRAFESFRVVPLGHGLFHFRDAANAGAPPPPLHQQIRDLLHRAVEHADQQIAEAQADKQNLVRGIK